MDYMTYLATIISSATGDASTVVVIPSSSRLIDTNVGVATHATPCSSKASPSKQR
jgi:hypothetical protein